MPAKEPAPPPPLVLESRRVADLLNDPRNARVHPKRNIEVMRASLRLFGQQKNIVILSDGIVIAGNGWLEASRQEGAEYVSVKVFDGTLAEARAYGLIDNRSAELAEWDMDVLAEDVGLSDEFPLTDLGWDKDEIDQIARLRDVAAGRVDASAEWAAAGMPEYESENLLWKYRTVVHFATEDDADAFFEFIGRPKLKIFWWPAPDGHRDMVSELRIVGKTDE